ncbi:hypothetical protein [Azospirillum sp. B506]|uniref:hypothetical protein n=1 Tax=Azospirillum sp. B506 TaxID=137721 RepID=UPI0003498B03|nr:hypothetical protein [Azospirillum sp. B506]
MDDRPDNRQGQPPRTRPESPPSTAGPQTSQATPNAAASLDPVLDRLDRLSELLMRRIDRLEERVRSLEQGHGEIITC